MTDNTRKRLAITPGTLLLLLAVFSVGFVARNLADGIHSFYLGLSVPASDSPVKVGEILSIQSMTNEAINRDALVLSDTTINLPLVGIVDVRDQTTTGIEQLLNKEYAEYFLVPQVHVFRSTKSRSR